MLAPRLRLADSDSVASRFIAANDHPDHDTIATFRRRFLPEIEHAGNSRVEEPGGGAVESRGRRSDGQSRSGRRGGSAAAPARKPSTHLFMPQPPDRRSPSRLNDARRRSGCRNLRSGADPVHSAGLVDTAVMSTEQVGMGREELEHFGKAAHGKAVVADAPALLKMDSRSARGSELGLTGFTSCGKAKLMGP